MILLSISHQEFTNLDYEARDRFIVTKMIAASPTLANRITAPEKLYHQRKLVGTLTQQIKEQEKEIKSLNETIEWMHAMIWDELRKKQALKEEVRRLKNWQRRLNRINYFSGGKNPVLPALLPYYIVSFPSTT